MVETSPWFDRLARAGFATKGAVYTLIGALAISYAVGGGGKLTGGEGALKTIGQGPFGKVLLVLTAIGLFGYSAWRCAQALLNTDRLPHGAKSTIKRIGYFISALAHGALAVLALQIMTGDPGGGGKESWLIRLLGSGVGRVGLAIGAVCLIGVGVAQLKKAYTADFKDRLARERMTAAVQRSIEWIARFGLAARGVILPLIGFLLLRAVMGKGNLHEVGVDGALRTIAEQRHGAILIGAVALGLIAYGVYMFTWAKYRRTS